MFLFWFLFQFISVSALTQAVTWGLQAAGCLPSSLARVTPSFSGKAFLLYSLSLFHVSSWVNFEGFDLHRSESTQSRSQGDFWAWQDKMISSFCRSSFDLLSASARLLVQLQVFVIPRRIICLKETSPCRQREGSTQTDTADGSLLGTVHNTKEKAKGF